MDTLTVGLGFLALTGCVMCIHMATKLRIANDLASLFRDQRDRASNTAANQLEELRLQRDLYREQCDKLQKARKGIEHIKQNELWGVRQNCDAVLEYLDKREIAVEEDDVELVIEK